MILCKQAGSLLVAGFHVERKQLAQKRQVVGHRRETLRNLHLKRFVERLHMARRIAQVQPSRSTELRARQRRPRLVERFHRHGRKRHARREHLALHHAARDAIHWIGGGKAVSSEQAANVFGQPIDLEPVAARALFAGLRCVVNRAGRENRSARL